MKRKKNTRMRGSMTHGHGHKKKRRGAGSRGGRGLSGMMKHKKFKMFKDHPNHFGKSGFRSLKQKGFKKSVRAINLNQLMKIAKGNE